MSHTPIEVVNLQHQRDLQYNDKDHLDRQALITQLEQLKIETPTQHTDVFAAYQQPRWFKKIPFKSTQERIDFIEELLLIADDYQVPLKLIKPFSLYKLYSKMQDRKGNLLFKTNSLSEEIACFHQYADCLRGKERDKLYRLLQVLPAKALNFFSRHLYNNRIFARVNMQASLYAFSIKQLDHLMALGVLAEKYQKKEYLEIGAVLLNDLDEDAAIAQVIEGFMENIVPLIIARIDQQEIKYPDLLRAWFKIWLQYQYPTIYKKEEFKEMAQLRHLPFEKIVQFLPTFILVDPEWYNLSLLLHLGSGQNIRKLAPYNKLTKKMAHLFINLKLNNNKECRYVWSFLYVLSPNYLLCKILYEYCFNSGWPRDKFVQLEQIKPLVLKLNEWFPSKELDQEEDIRDILSYYTHCQQVGLDFSVKGRTLASMLRTVSEWHESNYRIRYNHLHKTTWEVANYAPWAQTIETTDYQIVQLTTTLNLVQEGAYMRHCVATYATTCSSGHTSIWSLRRKNSSGSWKSLVTIEVTKARRIVQAKARCNAVPKQQHLQMIRAWAQREGLVCVQW